jgi:hypothetical protein
LEFEVGKHVYIKVSPMKGVKRFDVGKHVLSMEIGKREYGRSKKVLAVPRYNKGHQR